MNALVPIDQPPPPRLRLIVTADDFGIGVATSRGIVEAHLNGPVTSTSMMVTTGDHVRASLPLLEQVPEMALGLHLAFTNAGAPPLVATRASGLVGRDGRLRSMPQLIARAHLGGVNVAAATEEIVAQAELFAKLIGRPPDYFDAHHHAHQLPGLREAVADVVASGLLPPLTRVTIEPPDVRRHVRGAALKRAIANSDGRAAGQVFAEASLRANDWFVGMLSRADQGKLFPWESCLAHLPTDGIVEWVVHPGCPDETLVGRDSYLAERAAELRALTNKKHRSMWDRPEWIRIAKRLDAMGTARARGRVQ